jgi:GTPase
MFLIQGLGTAVAGTLLLDPDAFGQLESVTIKSIHRKRPPVSECRGSQIASFALERIHISELRKGLVIISEKYHPHASLEFEAEILVLHHPTTISVNYQAMGEQKLDDLKNFRLSILFQFTAELCQTATIMSMSIQHLRTCDKALFTIRFIKNPEFLRVGSKLIFTEGRTKAIGKITKVNLSKV